MLDCKLYLGVELRPLSQGGVLGFFRVVKIAISSCYLSEDYYPIFTILKTYNSKEVGLLSLFMLYTMFAHLLYLPIWTVLHINRSVH